LKVEDHLPGVVAGGIVHNDELHIHLLEIHQWRRASRQERGPVVGGADHGKEGLHRSDLGFTAS
jgi:hypothetical protein